MNLKMLLIIILAGFITAVHLLYTGSNPGFHVLHQQLFFVPIVLTSFWYGMTAGFIASVVISCLYAPTMLMGHQMTSAHLIVFTQVTLYLFIALLMGWLSDRQRAQQELMLKNERAVTLGKAASGVSLEVQDIVKTIDEVHRQSGGLMNETANDVFYAEIERLKRLLGALQHFTPSLERFALSTDLNDILQHSYESFREEATRKSVKIVVEQDGKGCPSTIQPETISRIFDSLVSNAIDFSEKGQTVILQSIRGGQVCSLEVIDSGPGVSKENEGKLFSTFFTTKEDGYGLSLSAGRKVLRDLGGDLVYKKRQNGGAIFKMIVPREQQNQSIGDVGKSSKTE